MCGFEYKKFDSCGEYGILVSEVCDEVLWRAGLDGKLRICVPPILERSLEWSGPDDHEPPKPVLFAGYDGFCEMCVEKFKLPCTIPRRSYSDYKLDYSRRPNSFNPDDSAPYISFSGFTATIPELLGVADQFMAARMKQGPCIIFHQSLEQRTWSQLRRALPFTYRGAFEAGYTRGIVEALERLNLSTGTTKYDTDHILYALKHGARLRVLYNTIFRPRGMPLGYFRTVTVNDCHQVLSQAQARMDKALQESAQQYSEYSDDSDLTTLTRTPLLSDLGLPVTASASRIPELPESIKYDGATSSHHITDDHQMLHAFREGQQAAAIKLALAAICPTQGTKAPFDVPTKADTSIVQVSATGDSSAQLKEDEIEVAPAQECAVLDVGRIQKPLAREAQHEQPSTAQRPRRMAIAGQEGNEQMRRLGLPGQGRSDAIRPPLGFPGTMASPALTVDSRGTRADEKRLSGNFEDEPKSEQRQQQKDSRQGSGNESSSQVPYYKASQVFRWKALETPGYKRTRRVTEAGGTRDHHQPQTLGAQQPPAERRANIAQQQLPQHDEAVLIQDDSDEDMRVQESARSASQLQTRLDPSTVRRLRDSGLLGKTRRR